MVVKKYKLFNKKFLAKTVTWKLIDGVVTFTLCFLLTGELFISVNLAILEVLVESGNILTIPRANIELIEGDGLN